MNKWDIIIGSLLYALPLWSMPISILISSFDKTDIFLLAVSSMIATLSIGMNLMRINYLENEIEQLKNKSNENE